MAEVNTDTALHTALHRHPFQTIFFYKRHYHVKNLLILWICAVVFNFIYH